MSPCTDLVKVLQEFGRLDVQVEKDSHQIITARSSLIKHKLCPLWVTSHDSKRKYGKDNSHADGYQVGDDTVDHQLVSVLGNNKSLKDNDRLRQKPVKSKVREIR